MKNLLLLVILIIFSGFFSGSETAFFYLGKVKLEKFKKRNRKALKIEQLKSRPYYFLSSLLLGNMFVNIAFSSLITVFLVSFSQEYGVFYSVCISSFIILVFGEILPKGLAVYTAENFALFSSYILRVFSRITYPLSFLIIFISRSFFKLVFRRELKEVDSLTEEELKEALEVGRNQGFIDEEEQDMIHSILDFSEVEASEIMTPRVDVKAIDIEDEASDIDKKLKNIRHSYVPVYKETIDNIVGVLRSKDYFLKKSSAIEEFLRTPFFIPESKNISDLLKELISRKEKMALVMDEYGGFSGVVTLEDVQEEIFGEVYDEYEIPLKPIEKISDREFLVIPRISVRDFNYELDLEIPEEEDTVGGFVLSCFERFPNEGEEISCRNVQFIVEKATRKKIVLLRVKIKK